MKTVNTQGVTNYKYIILMNCPTCQGKGFIALIINSFYTENRCSTCKGKGRIEA